MLYVAVLVGLLAVCAALYGHMRAWRETGSVPTPLNTEGAARDPSGSGLRAMPLSITIVPRTWVRSQAACRCACGVGE